MTGVLLDSDILIELLRGRNTAIRSRFEELLIEGATLFYSAVSAAEIWHGAREGEAKAISTLLAFLNCLPVDCVAAGDGGKILRSFRKSHQIGLGDALIAATVISHGLQLWTQNRKHYPDLRINVFE